MVAERNLGKTVALVELRHQGQKKVMSFFPVAGEIGKPVKAAVLLSAKRKRAESGAVCQGALTGALLPKSLLRFFAAKLAGLQFPAVPAALPAENLLIIRGEIHILKIIEESLIGKTETVQIAVHQ